MKKLRLIKPWQLRTIRQRLCVERMIVEEVIFSSISSRGPVHDEDANPYAGLLDFRFENTFDENRDHPSKAPVSNLIFVPANIRGNLN